MAEMTFIELDDEKTWRKIIGIWQESSIPGLRFKLVHEDVQVLWQRGVITTFPLQLFMALSVKEIIEIINREMKNAASR
jgi:hypothetical protein